MSAVDFILSMRGDPEDRGHSLHEVLARAAARGDEGVTSPEDQAEETALRYLTVGYEPGQVQALSQRLADVSAELQGEREKIERGQRRSAQVMRMHGAGQISAFQVPEMLGDDLGDEGRVARLQAREASLRRQMEAVQETAALASRARPEGPFEAAASRAHAAFRDATRAKMAAAEAGRPEPRPFAFRAGFAARAEEQPVDCPECHALDADWETSVLIHKQAEMDGVDLGQRSTYNPVAYR